MVSGIGGRYRGRIHEIRRSEDDVVVVTIEQPGTVSVQPPLGGQCAALWVGTMVAGIVVNALYVSFGTALDVVPHGRGVTVLDRMAVLCLCNG